MNERLTDPLDQAQQREHEIISDAIANVPKPPEPIETDEDVECEICGDVITPHRRALLGYTTCTSCQDYEEKRSKGYTKLPHYSYED